LDRSLVSTLASNDLKSTSLLAHDEGFNNSLFSYGGHQLRQVTHDLPGLIGIWVDLFDRNKPANRSTR
jgi:hypothetical protein